MAVQKVLARGWIIEVESLDTPGTWIRVKGINTIQFGADKTQTDVTDFDDQGNASHLVAERKETVKLEGFYMEDPSLGTRDPGQAMVERVARLVGNNSLGQFRFTSPGGHQKKFYASATVQMDGGKNDAMSWKVDLDASGVITNT